MEKEKMVSILNDLICINMDRFKGYEKASDELVSTFQQKNRPMFMVRAHESRTFVEELSTLITQLNGKPVENTSTAGKLYRMWMDLKLTFSMASEKSVFESCEFGEEVALKSYNKALEENWTPQIAELLSHQRDTLREAHDIVKQYGDEMKKGKA